MSEHKATIKWARTGAPEDFGKGKYSREHTWTFDGGVTVPASPSASVVPVPWSNPAGVDPEEGYVASIASCHMLTFVYVAHQAVGVLTKSERGATPWVSLVTLHPKVVYGGAKRPTDAEEEHLHHEAHAQCFIANSVKTDISVKR